MGEVGYVVLVGLLGFAAIFYASVAEWFVHSVVYHRWFKPQHDRHHAEYSGPRFRQSGPYRSLQPWWFEVVVLALHAPLFVWIGRSAGVAAGALTFVVIAGYAALSNYLHTAIHRPQGRWLEHTRWYRGLVTRHRAHHRELRTHYNIPLGLGDRCFRTVSRAHGGGVRSASA